MPTALLQILPVGSVQTPKAIPTQALDLSPAPSAAEQSLLAHGLSSVYDPNQDEPEEVKTVTAADTRTAGAKAAESRAVVALTASPSEVLDNRFVLMWVNTPCNNGFAPVFNLTSISTWSVRTLFVLSLVTESKRKKHVQHVWFMVGMTAGFLLLRHDSKSHDCLAD